MDWWWKYLAVFLWATFKFVIAPVTGYMMGLHWLENTLLTIAGMMLTFTLVSFLGESLKSYLKKRRKRKPRKKRKTFSRRNRLIVQVWSRFGVQGICFLTPILFSPILGSLLAVSLEKNIRKSWFYMSICTIFWALILSLMLHYGGDQVVKWLK